MCNEKKKKPAHSCCGRTNETSCGYHIINETSCCYTTTSCLSLPVYVFKTQHTQLCNKYTLMIAYLSTSTPTEYHYFFFHRNPRSVCSSVHCISTYCFKVNNGCVVLSIQKHVLFNDESHDLMYLSYVCNFLKHPRVFVNQNPRKSETVECYLPLARFSVFGFFLFRSVYVKLCTL